MFPCHFGAFTASPAPKLSGRGSARRVKAAGFDGYAWLTPLAASLITAATPSSLARALVARGGLNALKLPFDTAPLAVSQFWHERFQRDDGHHWLRAIIHELFRDDRSHDATQQRKRMLAWRART